MALVTVSGVASTFNLTNYHGTFWAVGAKSTVLLRLLGGLNGNDALVTPSYKFQFQVQEFPSPENTSRLEGAAAPTAKEWGRTPVTNVTQIWHETVAMTYSAQASNQLLGGLNTGGLSNPIVDPFDHQINLHLEHFANSVNYIFWNGQYVDPGDPTSTARKTRGFLEAITTNVVDANDEPLSREMVDEALNGIWEMGGLDNPADIYMFAPAAQASSITDAYGKEPLDSRSVGGMAIDNILTHYGKFGRTPLEKHLPSGTIAFLNMSVARPVFNLIPDRGGQGNRGVIFVEPLAKDSSSDKVQIYSEFGLDHGPELKHAKIVNLKVNS